MARLSTIPIIPTISAAVSINESPCILTFTYHITFFCVCQRYTQKNIKSGKVHPCKNENAPKRARENDTANNFTFSNFENGLFGGFPPTLPHLKPRSTHTCPVHFHFLYRYKGNFTTKKILILARVRYLSMSEKRTNFIHNSTCITNIIFRYHLKVKKN